MRAIYGAIQQLGGEVLAVSFEPPEQVAALLLRQPLPFRLVSDPERVAYRAFGLGSASVGSFLRPRVIWGYLKKIFRGWLPRPPAGNADALQLGGDFILDREGKVTYAHPSQDATDRPSAETLLAEMRRIAKTGLPE